MSDNVAVASRPSGARLGLLGFTRIRPGAAVRAGLLLGLGAVCLSAQAVTNAWNAQACGVVFLSGLVTVVWFLLTWRSLRHHFLVGDVVPSVIVSARPLLVASFTNLMKEPGGRFPALSIDRVRPRHLPPGQRTRGQRLLSVAMYEAAEDELEPAWKCFYPLPLSQAVRNPTALAARLRETPDEEWIRLAKAVSLVDTTKVGLYKLWRGRRNLRVKPGLEDHFNHLTERIVVECGYITLIIVQVAYTVNAVSPLPSAGVP